MSAPTVKGAGLSTENLIIVSLRTVYWMIHPDTTIATTNVNIPGTLRAVELEDYS